MQEEKSPLALDDAAVDLLTSLGVVPGAVCNRPSYRPGRSDVVLPDGVADIGLSFEPNLELMSALNPSLIVCGSRVGDAGALEQIAPVLSLELYAGQTNAYEAIEQALRTTAQAVNRTSEAETALAEAGKVFARCKQRLTVLGHRHRLYLVDLGFGSGKVGIFGSCSLPHAIITRLGLFNAWTEPDEPWGWATVDLARLADDPSAMIVWLQQYGPSGTSVEHHLMQTALWKQLPAARVGRVIGLPPTDLFGGLQTATRFALLVTDALLEHETR